MNWTLYKEGQGKWARNSVAATIALLGVFAASSLYDWLGNPGSSVDMTRSTLNQWFGVEQWPVDYRFVIVGPFLVLILWFGVWQYNHYKWADFLIDTENELKNRVTWPTGKEVLTNSIVVVVTVVILGIYIFFADAFFHWIQDNVYSWFPD